jgi:ketosteroid isomerase-like protein
VPNSDDVGARTVALRFLEAIASRDCDRILQLCSEDVVFEWPMMNERIDDAELFRAEVGPVLEPMDGLAFHDVVVDEMLDPNRVTLRYSGSATMSTTGKPYNQTYIAQLHVEAGAVTLFREYYNPAALTDALTPDA